MCNALWAGGGAERGGGGARAGGNGRGGGQRRPKNKPWGDVATPQSGTRVAVPPALQGPTPAVSSATPRRPSQGGKKAPGAVPPEKRDMMYAQLLEMGETPLFLFLPSCRCG